MKHTPSMFTEKKAKNQKKPRHGEETPGHEEENARALAEAAAQAVAQAVAQAARKPVVPKLSDHEVAWNRRWKNLATAPEMPELSQYAGSTFDLLRPMVQAYVQGALVVTPRHDGSPCTTVADLYRSWTYLEPADAKRETIWDHVCVKAGDRGVDPTRVAPLWAWLASDESCCRLEAGAVLPMLCCALMDAGAADVGTASAPGTWVTGSINRFRKWKVWARDVVVREEVPGWPGSDTSFHSRFALWRSVVAFRATCALHPGLAEKWASVYTVAGAGLAGTLLAAFQHWLVNYPKRHAANEGWSIGPYVSGARTHTLTMPLDVLVALWADGLAARSPAGAAPPWKLDLASVVQAAALHATLHPRMSGRSLPLPGNPVPGQGFVDCLTADAGALATKFCRSLMWLFGAAAVAVGCSVDLDDVRLWQNATVTIRCNFVKV